MKEEFSFCNRNCKFLEIIVVIYFGILNKSVCHLKKVTIIPLRDDISAPVLSCWTCLHIPEVPDVDCVESNKQNMTKSVCSLHQPFCKIQRLKDGSHVERLQRSCSKDCRPGCNKFETIRRCDSCCTQPLCNYDNHAVTIVLKSKLLAVCTCAIFLTSLFPNM